MEGAWLKWGLSHVDWGTADDSEAGCKAARTKRLGGAGPRAKRAPKVELVTRGPSLWCSASQSASLAHTHSPLSTPPSTLLRIWQGPAVLGPSVLGNERMLIGERTNASR